MSEIDDLMDRIKAKADTDSAEEFVRRLQVTEVIYAYLVKRFEERWPEAHLKWYLEGEE